jgi:hypothetical protein
MSGQGNSGLLSRTLACLSGFAPEPMNEMFSRPFGSVGLSMLLKTFHMTDGPFARSC